MNNITVFTHNLAKTKEIAHRQLIGDGIYSDESEQFLFPNQFARGERVTITLRVFKDNLTGSADGVTLNLSQTTADGTVTTCGEPMSKQPSASDLFDYYQATVTIERYTQYHFAIQKNRDIYYYNKQGLVDYPNGVYDFKAIPDFFVPEWSQGAVMYHVFVDRFYNGDPSNDVLSREYSYLGNMAKQQPDWNAPVGDKDFCTFYGGDLQGILDKLDYLESLGVEVIYLSPVLVSPSNHKYDISDYEHIDPHFGVIMRDGGKQLPPGEPDNRAASKYIRRTTDPLNLRASNAFFAEFMQTCHARGMRVIMDGVFNHNGSFHKWLNKEGIYPTPGAYQDKNSPYVDYFHFHNDDWPNNISYDGWWGHSNHPKLNFENSRELYDYILDIGKLWVSEPYGVDGWRLDVAADLGFSKAFNHQFWRDFRTAVKEANPEAIILGEHYGDCQDWLGGDQWDTIMNYDAFMEPLTWFLTGMQKHSDSYNPDKRNNTFMFEQAMAYNRARMSYHSVFTSMNQLSNHDHSRFLTRTNGQVGRLHTRPASDADHGTNLGIFYEAVVFQMTWPGAPTLYYGDEAGLGGWTDPDNRRPYPWGKENQTAIGVHREAIALRKRYSCLKTGSVEYLHNEHGVLSFARFDKHSKVAVILNNNDSPRVLKLPVWKMDMYNGEIHRVMYTNAGGYNTESVALAVVDGYVELYIGEFSSVVLAC